MNKSETNLAKKCPPSFEIFVTKMGCWTVLQTGICAPLTDRQLVHEWPHRNLLIEGLRDLEN